MNSTNHSCRSTNGYCNQCKTSVCKECTENAHFTHIESIENYTVKVAERINHLCRLKVEITKALRIREMLHRTKPENMVKELEDTFRSDSAQFLAFVSDHRKEVMKKIRKLSSIHKIKELQSKIRARCALIESLRQDNRKHIEQLLKGIQDDDYNKERMLTTHKEKLEEQKKTLKELRSILGDREKYAELLREMGRIEAVSTGKTNRLTSVYKLNGKELGNEGISYPISGASEVVVCYPFINTCKIVELKSTLKVPKNCGTIEIGNLLYLIGGMTSGVYGLPTYLASVYEINLNDGSIRTLKPLKQTRKRAAIVSVAQKYIYVMGGDAVKLDEKITDRFLDSCEKLDIPKNEWVACPKINKPRTNICAATYNDRFIYLFGGFNDEYNDVGLIECLDTAKEKAWRIIELAKEENWSSMQAMAAVQIAENEILIFGGMREMTILNQSIIFKVEEREFEKTECMKQVDTFVQQRSKVISDTVYAFGSHLDKLHAFDIKMRTWSLIKHKEEYTFKS